MDMMQADPAQPGMMGEQEEAPGGTELCIAVAQDGSITYYTEKDGQPGDPQPAQDIGAALKMALDAYRSLESGAESSGFESVADDAPAQTFAQRKQANRMQPR